MLKWLTMGGIGGVFAVVAFFYTIQMHQPEVKKIDIQFLQTELNGKLALDDKDFTPDPKERAILKQEIKELREEIATAKRSLKPMQAGVDRTVKSLEPIAKDATGALSGAMKNQNEYANSSAPQGKIEIK